jgi:hypothetical protein
LSPAIEALFDRSEYVAQVGEEAVVRSQAAGQLPYSFDGRQLWAVWREKQQAEHGAIFSKQRLEEYGMVVPGVVEHDHHALAARTMSQKLLQEALKGNCVELLAHGAYKFAGTQTDRTKACDGFAGGGVHQHRILDLGWHPHPASRAMLLEVAFVQAPQFNVLSLCQTAQFF